MRRGNAWPYAFGETDFSWPYTLMLISSAILALRVYPLDACDLPDHLATAPGEDDSFPRCSPVIIQIELNDGTLGHGETTVREEPPIATIEGLLAMIERIFMPELLTMSPEVFADALERIDALPLRDDVGMLIPEARAGIELALLSAYSRFFERPISEVNGWLGLVGFGPPGSQRSVRRRFILDGSSPASLKQQIRWARLRRVHDFKLLLPRPGHIEAVEIAAETLGQSLGDTATLQVDAVGAWPDEVAGELLQRLAELNVTSVEQPLAPQADELLPGLRSETTPPLVLDESVSTSADLSRLEQMGLTDGLVIEILKHGGFMPAMKLAAQARKSRIPYELGLHRPNTELLSAIRRAFVENVPGLAFVDEPLIWPPWPIGRNMDVPLASPEARRRLKRRDPEERLGWPIAIDTDRLPHMSTQAPTEFRL
jgi:L-alanine-DL-glutamate epimerase-like enolase superfamily enzyme